MISLWWIALVLLISIQDVDVQSIPRNTAAPADSEVKLDCTFPSAPQYVRWKEYTTSDAGLSIFSGSTMNDDHPRRARYSVTPTGGTQFNLTISFLKAEDAGYYTCSGTDHANPSYGAYIMHLGPKSCNVSQSGKVVGTVAEGEQFTVFCQRDYSSVSRWPPILQLRELTFTTNSTTATNVWYEVNIQAEESLNGKKYHCTTTFINPPPFKPTDQTFQDDTRLPTFAETDCETTINVHWPAKNIKRVPEQQVYYPGDSVTCSASINPEPATFKWEKLSGSGPQEIQGAVLDITEDMYGTNYYNCVVTNKVKEELDSRSQNFTFKVEATPTSPVFTRPISGKLTTKTITHLVSGIWSTQWSTQTVSRLVSGTDRFTTAVTSIPFSTTEDSCQCLCGQGFKPELLLGMFVGILLMVFILVIVWFVKFKLKSNKDRGSKVKPLPTQQVQNHSSVKETRSSFAEYAEITDTAPSVPMDSNQYQELQKRNTDEKEYAELHPVNPTTK